MEKKVDKEDFSKKQEHEKYAVQRQLRLTQQMDELIKAKALEKHTSDSEIIRQAITNYINRSMSDTEIVHAALMENSRKIRYLENKVELLALVTFEQTKLLFKLLPTTHENSDFIVSRDYDKFMKNCTKLLRTNHTGVLESMILDSYEQSGEDEN